MASIMHKKPAGFTLLEIVIVLVIVALMSSLVTLNVGSGTYSNFINQANKLALMFEVISDDAVYTNSVIICDPSPTGLDCQSYKDGQWSDVTLSKLTTFEWPKDMKIEQIIINGLPIKPGDKIRFSPNGGANNN